MFNLSLATYHSHVTKNQYSLVTEIGDIHHTMSDTIAERVASNAAFLFAAQLITGGLSLITMVLLPRYYGATGIGVYHLASSLWTITALLIGFGTDVVITREIARDKERVSELVSVGLLLRIAFHFVGYIAVVIFANVAGYSSEIIQIVFIFGIANFMYQLGHIFSAALYGLEKLKIIALAGILVEIVVTGGIVGMIVSGQSIVMVATISILAGFSRTAFLFLMLRKQTVLQFILKVSLIPWMIKEGASILVNRLLLNVYAQADVIIISLFVNETVVGWYSVADVAYGALLMIPNIISTALFPTLSRLFIHEPDRLPVVARRSLNMVLLFAVPMGLGIFIVSRTILMLIVGDEFVNSVPVMAGFGIVTIFTSVNIFLGQLLIAINKQNKLSVLLIIAIALTLPIDLLLIPWTQEVWGNGALGGVISYLITEAVILAGSLIALPKGLFVRQNASFALRVIIAGGVMFILTWPLRNAFLLWPVLLGTSVYLIAAFILKLIMQEEINLARGVCMKGWQRFRELFSTVPN